MELTCRRCGGGVTRVYFERDCCVEGDLEIIYTNIKKNTKLQTVTVVAA